jgi:nucleotide-binding universal stress UspA family protein
MKKILVPIDNSKVSKSAVAYAINLAKSFGCEIILLSVINAGSNSGTLISWRILEEELVRNDRQDVTKMLQELRAETGSSLKITHKQALGFPVHEIINRFVVENGIDLIVMGTSGAKGLKKLLAGTNTASVIDTSSVPVIAVPKTAKPKNIRRIVYATDMSHLDDEIKTIARFAKPLDADIEVVHLSGESHRSRNRSELQTILVRMAKYRKIHLNVTGGVDIAKGLRALASKHKADLIIMFTHELDFFEKLFGRGHTRQVAYDSAVPLMAFNRKNSHL